MRKSAKNQLIFNIMSKKNNDAKFLAKESKIDRIFNLVKDESNKVHIVVGNYRVTQKKFDTFEQADEYIERKPYEIIFNVASIIAQNILKTQENENVNENPQNE